MEDRVTEVKRRGAGRERLLTLFCVLIHVIAGAGLSPKVGGNESYLLSVLQLDRFQTIPIMKSRPVHLRQLRQSLRPRLTSPSRPLRPFPAPITSFHSSSSRFNTPPSAPQSPFRVFVQTLKEEIQKNRELQQDVQRLQGDVDKLADSETMKRAREMYERTRLTNALKNNPKLKEAADNMKAAGGKISDGVAEAMKAVEESDFMRNVSAAHFKSRRTNRLEIYHVDRPVSLFPAHQSLCSHLLLRLCRHRSRQIDRRIQSSFRIRH